MPVETLVGKRQVYAMILQFTGKDITKRVRCVNTHNVMSPAGGVVTAGLLVAGQPLPAHVVHQQHQRDEQGQPGWERRGGPAL